MRALTFALALMRECYCEEQVSEEVSKTPDLGAFSTADFVPGTEREPPANLGRFVRLDTLGSGGMGAVYGAWDRELQRRVALKILHGDDRERSLREAQALARLRHPNVVTVHDVGSAEGVDYIAMELVEGSSLREWLEQPRSWREVLAVYLQAGRGLVAAHAAGLVHRDFKPANVLIGNDGAVRVADFGLARSMAMALDDRVIEAPGAKLLDGALTRTGALVGTPRYMAPEQRDGKVPDPSMDQYSFSIALWESLFGKLPDEEAPTLRVATGRVPAWLRAALERGCARAPADRFPSLAALLVALDRDRPRIRLVAAVVGGVLAAVAIVGLVLHHQAEAAEQAMVCKGSEAKLAGIWDPAVAATVRTAFLATARPHAGDTVTRVTTALDERTAAWVAMRGEACEATSLRHEQSAMLLDLRVQCLDRRLTALHSLTELFTRADGPLVDNAVAAVYRLDDLDSCADARSLLGAAPLPADPLTQIKVAALRSQLTEATTLQITGRFRAAAAMVQPIVDQARTLNYPPLLGDALLLLGWTQMTAYDKRSQATAEETILVLAAANDDEQLAVVWLRLLNIVGVAQKRPTEALALRPGVEAAVIRAGNKPLRRANFDRNVASILRIQGKYDEALVLQRRALATLLEVLDHDDPAIGNTRNSIGLSLMHQGKYDEALAEYAEALTFLKRVYGPEHPEIAGLLINIGNVHSHKGEYNKAIEALEHALAIQEHTVGSDHVDVAETLDGLGDARLATGDVQGALRDLERAGAIFAKHFPADHLNVAENLRRLGATLVSAGRFEEGRAASASSLAIFEQKLDAQNPSIAEALAALGDALAALDKRTEAAAAYQRALAIELHDRGGDNDAAADTELAIARLTPEGSDALTHADHALTIREHLFGPDHVQVGSALGVKADVLLAHGRAAEALPILERGVHLLAAGSPVELAGLQFALARALWMAPPRDTERIHQLVTTARDTLVAAKPVGARELAALTTWQKTHDNL